MAKSTEQIRAEAMAATSAAAIATTVATGQLAPAPNAVEQGIPQPVEDVGAAVAESTDARALELVAELAKLAGVPTSHLMGLLTAVPAPVQSETRIFYTSIPHTAVFITRGPSSAERVPFIGNMLETSDPAVIAHVSAIADKPGSTIYTKSDDHIVQEVERMRGDTFRDAAIAHAKMIAAGLPTA